MKDGKSLGQVDCVLCKKNDECDDYRYTRIGWICPACFPAYEITEDLLVAYLLEEYLGRIKRIFV